jgi:CheY-like chemotaxis protein
LLKLIDGVLDLTQIDSGNVSLAIENFAPSKVLAQSMEIARSIADRNGITLTDLTEGKTIDAIRADSTRFQQVLLNLLSNAIKYNRKDGSAALDSAPLEGGMMRFTVSDTGRGISSKDKGAIFSPFHRLGMEKGSIEGAGVGLTISRSLVEQMGGKLTFESRPGEGSSFYVDLPIADEGDAEIAPALDIETDKDDISTEDAIVRKILYIEDNPDLVTLMEYILKRQSNLELISCHNAETGLAVAEKESPDIILMDINLPGMNGLDALRKLKADPCMRDIPIVAVSGAAMKHDVDQGAEAGFDAYLTKPYRMRDVVATINDALANG